MLARMSAVLVAAVATLVVAAGARAEDSRLDSVQKNALRVCTPGDYKPFSLAKPDGTYEGLDVDLAPDQWLHLAKASGRYDRTLAAWLK